MSLREQIFKSAGIAILLSGLGAFLGGIALLISGSILAGLFITLLGILLMLLLVRLTDQQQALQQATPQQTTAQEMGQQGNIPQQGIVAYPPVVIAYPQQESSRQSWLCPDCDALLPAHSNYCPICGKPILSKPHLRRVS